MKRTLLAVLLVHQDTSVTSLIGTPFVPSAFSISEVPL